ncbi:uncharacterized protein LOC115746891 [Rhodamnia argentea]|uniref:Uncharacterized protein LOC115746891 n=1 Tax=Rhodamnia argentea TaxID=178133 RepID=A0ABM3HPB4_9MYRT|nr:uncharacterized protein LOC115746891 [Rhodamnia argentea]
MASVESFAHGSEPGEEATELEIPEVDGALLREILEELDKDNIAMGSGNGGGRGEYVVQPLEVHHHPNPVADAPSSEQERVLAQDLDWLEDLVLPGDEVKMGWYGDEMVGAMEFHYVVEDGNWEFYDRIASEDMGF